MTITYSSGFTQTVCLRDMQSDIGASDAPQLLRCGPGDDTAHPAQVAGCYYWIEYFDGTCHWRIYFSVVDCDCETGGGCTWTVEGWENYDYPTPCPYTITDIEIIGSDCPPPCVCETLPFDVSISIQLSAPYGGACVTTPITIPILETLTCTPGVEFEIVADIDVDFCADGEPGAGSHCGSVRVFFELVGTCDCSGTDSCTVVVTGFEEINCTGGVTSVTLV